MNPVLKKLIIKIPAQSAAWKLAHPALVILSDAAVAALAPAPVVDPAIALYMALLSNELKAIATQRGLPVTNGDSKTVLTNAIIADGGDGTVSVAEQSAIDQYVIYLADTLGNLQTDADTRVPAVVYTVDDDTVEEMARLLLADDAF